METSNNKKKCENNLTAGIERKVRLLYGIAARHRADSQPLGDQDGGNLNKETDPQMLLKVPFGITIMTTCQPG